VGDLLFVLDVLRVGLDGLDDGSTDFSMPRLMASGLAPAATLRRPSRTMTWASRVAVVVPSPATSLVLVATSLTSWAPMFSRASSSSISLAMVTPSLVMVGCAELLLENDVAALGAEGDLHRIGQLVDAGLEAAAGLLVKTDLLRHLSYLLLTGLLGITGV
jgi:hypothetical protein